MKGFLEILDGKHDDLPEPGLLHGRNHRKMPSPRVVKCRNKWPHSSPDGRLCPKEKLKQ